MIYLLDSRFHTLIEERVTCDPNLISIFIKQPLYWVLPHDGRKLTSEKASDIIGDKILLQLVERAYPTYSVDWLRLRSRISPHIPHLQSILNIHSGRSDVTRALKLTQENYDSYTTGYYGLRGAYIMLYEILTLIGNTIQDAVDGKTIAYASHFAQTVLVPALTIRLVMEDMNIDKTKAREEIRETTTFGEIVNQNDTDEEGGNWITV